MIHPPFHPNCKCILGMNNSSHALCKCGIFCYEESADQRFCFMKIGDYEFIVFLN